MATIERRHANYFNALASRIIVVNPQYGVHKN